MHMRVGIGLHVEAVAVLPAGVEAFDERVPYLSRAVGAGIERVFNKGIIGTRPEEHQRAGGRILRKDGEVNTGAMYRGAER